MTTKRFESKSREARHDDPPFLARLFSDTSWSLVWILPRFYAGWVLLNAGWPLTRSAEWMERGEALRIALSPDGETQSWARPADGMHAGVTSLLLDTGAIDWVARLTAIGLTFAGIALILGLMTGLAAFTGIILSANIMIAGSSEPGPVVLGLAVTLAMSWKTAGWIGLDRWVLPALGAPWKGGALGACDIDGVADAAPARAEASK